MFEMTIKAKDGGTLSKVELADRPLRIGRGNDCDVRIGMPAISRQHAEIRPLSNSTWVIRDLGSTHGCRVRGHKVREMTITPGLEVEIGPAVVRFESLASRIGAEIDAMIDDDDDDETPVRVIGLHDSKGSLDETIG